MAKAGNLTYITRINPLTGTRLPAEGRRKIFISYKKTDNTLCGIRDIMANKALAAADVAVWFDENLTPGVDYESEIGNAISECDAVILLLTRDILHSDYVWENEIKTAVGQKKGIIPVACGILKSDYAEAERRLGGRIQILNTEGQKENFDLAFARAIDYFVVNADLALRAERFFASNKQLISPKSLTDEQKFIMGIGYLHGIGTAADEQKGIDILTPLLNIYGSDSETEKLKTDSAFELYNCFYNRKEYKQAYDYLKIAADLGAADAMFNLGVMCQNGIGTAQSDKTAVEWYEKAAALGDAEAMCNLAVMYDNGIVLPKNFGKAFELFGKSAKAGNANAMLGLGFMYEHGEGMVRDCTKAIEWYKKAAALNNSVAMLNIGFVYFDGKGGISRDYAKALEWFKKSAEAGNSDAMCNIGTMYCSGSGVEKSAEKAAEWYKKAAAAGNVNATENLKRLNSKGNGSPAKIIAVIILLAAAAVGAFLYFKLLK